QYSLGYDTSSILSSGRSKRFLTSITQRDNTSNALPRTGFDYYGVKGIAVGVNTGALKKIRFPSGGGVEYQYNAQALGNVALDYSIVFTTSPYPDLVGSLQSRFAGSDFFAIK